MIKQLIVAVSFIGVFIVGFMAGMYMLPILTAPTSPSKLELANHAQQAMYTGEFKAELPGSDFLHFAQGQIKLSNSHISFEGEISPGPDYQVYLADRFVDNETEFLAFKGTFTRVASIKTFNSFIVKIPQDVNIANFNTVIIWCESFDEFISAAKYQ